MTKGEVVAKSDLHISTLLVTQRAIVLPTSNLFMVPIKHDECGKVKD